MRWLAVLGLAVVGCGAADDPAVLLLAVAPGSEVTDRDVALACEKWRPAGLTCEVVPIYSPHHLLVGTYRDPESQALGNCCNDGHGIKINVADLGPYDLHTVIAHEIGHGFWIPHAPDSTPAIMTSAPSSDVVTGADMALVNCHVRGICH